MLTVMPRESSLRELASVTEAHPRRIQSPGLEGPGEESEIELLRVMVVGRNARCLLATEQELADDHRWSLQVVAMKGDLAREELVIRYIGLVEKLARRTDAPPGLRDDLVQEGLLGFHRAMDSFDLDQVLPFSGHAYRYIRRAIKRAIPEIEGLVRFPKRVSELRNFVRKVENRLISDGWEAIGAQDLADASGLNLIELVDLQTQWGFADVMSIESEGIDIDELIDAEQLRPDSEADELRRNIAWILSELPEFERLVLELRVGYRDGVPGTLDEVACVVGLSREQVRRSVNRSIQRLRDSDSCRGLEQFLDP